MAIKRINLSPAYFLLTVLAMIMLCTGFYFLWQDKKVGLAERKIKNSVLKKTDSLYSISFDSLRFNEKTGEAYLENIHIIPDTNKIYTMAVEERPRLLADIRIASISVKGIKTVAALRGKEISGDSVTIESPVVRLLFFDKIKQQTNIDQEAGALYRQLLGKLDLIQFSKVTVHNASISGIDMEKKEKDFDLQHAMINLFDVRIDSAHERDTARTLFTKQAYVYAEEFNTYHNGLPEIIARNIIFMGKEKAITVDHLMLTAYDEKQKAKQLSEWDKIQVNGLSTDQFIRNKLIIADEVTAASIKLFSKNKTPGKINAKAEAKAPKDPAGFSQVYGINVKQLSFPRILINPGKKDEEGKGFKIGGLSLKISDVIAKSLGDIKNDPIAQLKNIEIDFDDMKLNDKSSVYTAGISGIAFNSALKKFTIGKISLLPGLSEKAFAKKAAVQKDRYEIIINGLELTGVDVKALMDNKIYADLLTIKSAKIKAFRDLSYELEPISKVGNFPHQLLLKLKTPVNIKRAEIYNTYIEYKEKNPLSDSSGMVKLIDSRLSIQNITNEASVIAGNRYSSIDMNTKVLGHLPFHINAKFDLLSKEGGFNISGNAGRTDARQLNVISRPMALVELNEGVFNSINFNFDGNDRLAKGRFEFLYEDLKIKLLKKNDEGGNLKRKGIMSFIANKFVKNENPHDGEKRTFIVQYDRHPYKSFFNLVWKTLFTGLQETLGLPGKRNAVKL